MFSSENSRKIDTTVHAEPGLMVAKITKPSQKAQVAFNFGYVATPRIPMQKSWSNGIVKRPRITKVTVLPVSWTYLSN